MERMVVVGETTSSSSSSSSYVSWEEVYVSSDKGRREVHYYLKRRDDESDLAVIGKEKSLRHMSYHYALSFANGLINTNNRLKSRREVIDWLNSVVSGTYIFNWEKKRKTFFCSICFVGWRVVGFDRSEGFSDMLSFFFSPNWMFFFFLLNQNRGMNSNWVKKLVCKDPISSHGLFIRSNIFLFFYFWGELHGSVLASVLFP